MGKGACSVTARRKQAGLLCPALGCGCALHEVVETRKTAHGVTRRRECFNGHRFLTHENVQAAARVPGAPAT